MRGDCFGIREVLVHETEAGAVAIRRELDHDRRRARGNVFAAVPAPGEDELVGLVDLDVLATGDVAWDDLAAEDSAGLRFEVCVDALPAHELFGVDEKLPDCLRAGVDRERALVNGGLSCCVHASSAPPS